MTMNRFNQSLTLVALAGFAISANAQLITRWNFNSTTPDAAVGTGTTTPSTGTGPISLGGGATSTFATGSPGDTGGGSDNSGLNLTAWAAQATGNLTRGLQFATSTAGYSDIVVSLDFRNSATVSRFFQLQVSTDGTTFNNVSGGTTSFGAVNSNTGTSFSTGGLYINTTASGSQTFVQSISYTFPSGSAVENNPNAAFRWLATFDPSAGGNYVSSFAGTTSAYSPNGTGRFDMVSISGTAVPEPSEYAAMAGAGLVGFAIWRRRMARKA
jgi:hypothetical protein